MTCVTPAGTVKLWLAPVKPKVAEVTSPSDAESALLVSGPPSAIASVPVPLSCPVSAAPLESGLPAASAPASMAASGPP